MRSACAEWDCENALRGDRDVDLVAGNGRQAPNTAGDGPTSPALESVACADASRTLCTLRLPSLNGDHLDDLTLRMSSSE